MGLATALQELRERKREEEERKFQEQLAEVRREERERIIAFYREQAEENGQDFVEPPVDDSVQGNSNDR